MIAVVTFLGKLGLGESLRDHLNAKIFQFQYNLKLSSVHCRLASEVLKKIGNFNELKIITVTHCNFIVTDLMGLSVFTELEVQCVTITLFHRFC